jgi:hypothetical protein
MYYICIHYNLITTTYKIINMRDETITVRVEKKTKDQLMKIAKELRRDFSDYIRLVLTDAAEKKVKV